VGKIKKAMFHRLQVITQHISQVIKNEIICRFIILICVIEPPLKRGHLDLPFLVRPSVRPFSISVTCSSKVFDLESETLQECFSACAVIHLGFFCTNLFGNCSLIALD
jgi:hypothetical protein